MNKQKYSVKLKKKDLKLIKRSLSVGTEKARKLKRCQILLLSHEGKRTNEICSFLHVSRPTVIFTKKRYIRNGIDIAINEGPRPGAKEKFNAKQRASITAIACSNPPEGHSRWTVRLIADKAVELEIVDDIDYTTVHRMLKKTN